MQPFSDPSQAAPMRDENVLDDPQQWAAFGKQVDEANGLWESNLVIEGMHCAACAVTIESALRQVPGVQSVEVSAASQRARLRWSSSRVMPSQWLQAVRAAGYRAVPANDVFVRERRLIESRRALWRWLVSGLCMMQVMMYAYPAYVAAPGDLSAEMERLLRWASWVLTLPVILFSCGPFFKAAWRDIVHAQVSMDLPVAQVGDLVVVAFVQGDVRFPLVLGGLWHGAAAPPETMDGAGQNHLKVMRSRNGVKLTLDDQDGQEKMILETPGGQKLTLQDGPGSCELMDSNGNSIKLEAAGITVTASAKVTVNASTVEVSAGMVTVNAGMSRFSGVVQCDTLITNAVISTSYTPGAGNIW